MVVKPHLVRRPWRHLDHLAQSCLRLPEMAIRVAVNKLSQLVPEQIPVHMALPVRRPLAWIEGLWATVHEPWLGKSDQIDSTSEFCSVLRVMVEHVLEESFLAIAKAIDIDRAAGEPKCQ